MNKSNVARRVVGVAAISMLLTSHALSAGNYGGTITWLEVWRNGNVAFRLSDPTSTNACNGQFILNLSDAGTKNQYAALLAARKTGSTVSVTSYSDKGGTVPGRGIAGLVRDQGELKCNLTLSRRVLSARPKTHATSESEATRNVIA